MRGTVLGPDALPWPARRISVLHSTFVNAVGTWRQIATATTRLDGAFELVYRRSQYGKKVNEVDQRGEIKFHVDADSYAFAVTYFMEIDAAKPLVFKLVRDFPIRGRVLDLQGHTRAVRRRDGNNCTSVSDRSAVPERKKIISKASTPTHQPQKGYTLVCVAHVKQQTFSCMLHTHSTQFNKRVSKKESEARHHHCKPEHSFFPWDGDAHASAVILHAHYFFSSSCFWRPQLAPRPSRPLRVVLLLRKVALIGADTCKKPAACQNTTNGPFFADLHPA